MLYRHPLDSIEDLCTLSIRRAHSPIKHCDLLALQVFPYY